MSFAAVDIEILKRDQDRLFKKTDDGESLATKLGIPEKHWEECDNFVFKELGDTKYGSLPEWENELIRLRIPYVCNHGEGEGFESGYRSFNILPNGELLSRSENDGDIYNLDVETVFSAFEEGRLDSELERWSERMNMIKWPIQEAIIEARENAIPEVARGYDGEHDDFIRLFSLADALVTSSLGKLTYQELLECSEMVLRSRVEAAGVEPTPITQRLIGEALIYIGKSTEALDDVKRRVALERKPFPPAKHETVLLTVKAPTKLGRFEHKFLLPLDPKERTTENITKLSMSVLDGEKPLQAVDVISISPALPVGELAILQKHIASVSRDTVESIIR